MYVSLLGTSYFFRYVEYVPRSERSRLPRLKFTRLLLPPSTLLPSIDRSRASDATSVNVSPLSSSCTSGGSCHSAGASGMSFMSSMLTSPFVAAAAASGGEQVRASVSASAILSQLSRGCCSLPLSTSLLALLQEVRKHSKTAVQLLAFH